MSHSRKHTGVIKDRSRAGAKHALKRISARAARRANKRSTDVYCQPSRGPREAWDTMNPYDIVDYKSLYEPGFERYEPKYKWFMK